MSTKRCSKCGLEKALSEFSPDKRATLGVRSGCKTCANAANRIYSKTPRARELSRKNAANWRKRHPERAKEVQKRAYWAHRDKHLVEMAAYRAANREAMHERERKWREANRARKTEHERKRLALKRNAFVAEVDEQEIILRDLGLCGICGEAVCGPLHLDHVIPLAAGGTHEPKNVQLAHPICNQRKGARVSSR